MQIEIAKEALATGLKELGLQSTVELVNIRGGWRWVLSYDQEDGSPSVSHSLIRLERWLKKHTGQHEIDLLCEIMEDRNKRMNRNGRAVQLRGVESLD